MPSFKLKGKRIKKRKSIKGVENPTFDESTISNCTDNTLNDEEQCDIVLNVINEPTDKVSSNKEKKPKPKVCTNRNIGFVNNGFEARTIGTTAIRKMNFRDYGTGGRENEGFDMKGEKMQAISDEIEAVHADVENEFNELKENQIYIGEGVDSDGESREVADGIKLKYKRAGFIKVNEKLSRTKQKTLSLRPYRHLIKGDIILKFRKSNLYTVKGYGCT